ncbi:MAG: hypothetical protein K9W43_08205 [Candidatus Thorarchaeota archaeon]|nr:hypothetical protein [Candidatus Thorarchaeota archaeon]
MPTSIGSVVTRPNGNQQAAHENYTDVEVSRAGKKGDTKDMNIAIEDLIDQ